MNSKNDVMPHLRLLLNIKHPVLEDCWMEGFESAQVMLSEEDNPYKKDTVEYFHWLEGWWSGFYGEEPIHEIYDAEALESVPAIVNVPIKRAANEDKWQFPRMKTWFSRVATIAAITATVAVAYELID